MQNKLKKGQSNITQIFDSSQNKNKKMSQINNHDTSQNEVKRSEASNISNSEKLLLIESNIKVEIPNSSVIFSIENSPDVTNKESNKKKIDIKENINNINNIKSKVMENINIMDIMESKNKDPILSEILGDDDKLLFNLNALGSLQKNEKIAQQGKLLSVDDRWLFQGIRRWWTEDSKVKSASNTLLVLSDSSDRVDTLLECDYIAQLEEEKKTKEKLNNKNGLETPEEKKFNEKNEERRRIINKYLISISNAKSGIENSRDTYSDKFTKNKFNLAIQKADDVLNKLQKFKGHI
jgi:hypothetical protein